MNKLFTLVHWILRKLNIFILYRFGNAIGDQVCMSAIAKEMKIQKNFRVIVCSSYPEIFLNNPYIWKNIDIKKYSLFIRKFIVKFLAISKGGQIENFCFPSVGNSTFESYMRETKTKISLIEAHALHFKVKLDLKNTKPDIFFSDTEIEKHSCKFKELKNFAIIQPVGKTTYTPNKEWGLEKYQEIINTTKDTIKWVQVGFKDDVLLNQVIDMRGKTETLRELAYVVSKSKFTLSNEGLLNHIAASVNTKSFVVFSGFSQVELARYKTTIAIVRTPQVDCAPCWLLEACPKEKKFCTEDILVEDVVKTIESEMDII